MRVLALDASTHAGWALLEGEVGSQELPKLIEAGLIENDKPVFAFGTYPGCYLHAATSIANRLFDLVLEANADVIVIEETNLGKNRYTQKLLEFIHASLLAQLLLEQTKPVVYISSSIWRQAIGLVLSKDDKKNNARASKAKKIAKALAAKEGITESKARAQLKKSLGVKGRINKKHVAVRWVNENYGLSFKVKDNDRADAICLGVAYFKNAQPCDGV